MLFDLDGTLVDSAYQHVLAWHETFSDFRKNLAELGIREEK
jgi:beta-phosphoglucomutase-like phosphatase (HAD superfamily)